jgi:hypothetical protein
MIANPNAQALQEELEHYRSERDKIRSIEFRLTEMSRRMRELHENLNRPADSHR